MHARYYNPSLGRFLSVDPVGGSVGGSQSWNRYSYVLNSPINFVDPTGEEIALDIEDDEYLHDLLAQWEQESGLDLGLNDGIVLINGVKLNESGQPLGSEKARQILTDRINASDVFMIHGVSDDPNVWMGQAQGGHGNVPIVLQKGRRAMRLR